MAKTASPRPTNFPTVLAAVRELRNAEDDHWKAQWGVGDALCQECGRPGEVGVNDGSHEKLKKVGKELKEHGLGDWTLIYLRKLRNTAASFTDDIRLSSVSWSAHEAAGDPETLDAIVQRAERDKVPVTVAFVNAFKRMQSEKNDGSRDEQEPDDRSDPAIETSKSALLAAAAQSCGLAEVCRKKIELHLAELSELEIAGLMDAAQSSATAWNSVVKLLLSASKLEVAA